MQAVRDRSRLPVYAAAPAKVNDEEVRVRPPGALTDGIFFLIATLASLWLAGRLVADAWASWVHLLLLVPFWAVVAYLALPRLHRMLTSLYVPDYFFGRTRTSDGLLGDPVNLALNGTARQIHVAMIRSGWTLADDITLRSAWGIVVSSVARRSYPEAPVSPLFIFGRHQCLAYQREVGGDASKRHHVRFWRCPDGWLLPGGRRVQWLGAGTYDRAVGFSLFTLQVTHKIDADIDIERDYIVDTLEHACPDVDHEVIEGFSAGYHHVNGGGDRIQTDGDLPVVDLTRIGYPDDSAFPAAVDRAASGYPDPHASSAVASPDPDAPARVTTDTQRPSRPAVVVFAAVAVAVAVGAQALSLGLWLRNTGNWASDLGGSSDAERQVVGMVVIMLDVVLALLLLAIVALCALTLTGRARPRVWLLAGLSTVIVLGEIDRWTSAGGLDHSVTKDLSLAFSVLVLLMLSSPAAGAWSRRVSWERKEGRRAIAAARRR